MSIITKAARKSSKLTKKLRENELKSEKSNFPLTNVRQHLRSYSLSSQHSTERWKLFLFMWEPKTSATNTRGSKCKVNVNERIEEKHSNTFTCSFYTLAVPLSLSLFYAATAWQYHFTYIRQCDSNWRAGKNLFCYGHCWNKTNRLNMYFYDKKISIWHFYFSLLIFFALIIHKELCWADSCTKGITSSLCLFQLTFMFVKLKQSQKRNFASHIYAWD